MTAQPPPPWHPDLSPEPPPPSQPWHRKRWFIAALCGVGLLTIVAIGAAVTAFLVGTRSSSPAPPATVEARTQQWWLEAEQDFIDLQHAIDESQRAAGRSSLPDEGVRVVEEKCVRLHDVKNTMQSHLPSPDPIVNANVQGAIEDVERAVHGCVSAIAGAFVQLGEFNTDLDMASRQMQIAKAIVDKRLAPA